MGVIEDLYSDNRLQAAPDIPPDRAARVVDIGLKTGLPEPFIDRNLDHLETQIAKDFDVERFRKESPLFADWAAENPNHWSLIKDDIENLNALQWALTAFKGKYREGTAEVRLNQIWARHQAGQAGEAELTEAERLETQINQHDYGAGWFGEFITEFGKQAPQMLGGIRAGATTAMPAAMGGALIAGVAGQAGPQVAAPEEIVTVPAAFAIAGGAGFVSGVALWADEQERGAAFREISRIQDEEGNPIDPEVARAASTWVGMVNAFLEAGGTTAIAKNLPGVKQIRDGLVKDAVKEALKTRTFRRAMLDFAKNTAESVGTEIATEVMQESVSMFAGELAKRIDPDEFQAMTAEEFGNNLVQIAEKTFKATLIPGSAGPITQLGLDVKRVRDAQTNRRLFGALGEKASESKLRERVPAKFQELVQRIRESGAIESVRIPVDRFRTYFQNLEIDPQQMYEELGGTAEAYVEAELSGTDLSIDIDQYATKVAPTEHHAGLAEDLRLQPDDMTAREAAEWQQTASEVVESLEKEAPPPADTTAYQAIFDDVASQLEAANVERSAAERNAALMASVFDTLGQRTGLGAKALYERYGLRIRRELPEALRGELDINLDPLIDRLRAGDIPTDRDVFGDSLTDFLKERGGIQDQELSARDAGKEIRGLVKPAGMTLDEATEAAAEAGYIDEVDQAQFMEALDSELGGDLVFSGVADTALQDLQGVLTELGQFLETEQIDIQEADNEVIRRLLLGDATRSFEQTKRGEIRFDRGDTLISLAKNADLSTFLHESGHLYLEVLADLGESTEAPQQIRDDFNSVLNWMGVEGRDNIGREQHEQFARGFEAYLMEGKAPSNDLREVFARFRAWLIGIYRRLTALNVELSDEVRGVFDRLIATDDAISAAEETQNYVALFSDAEQAGMTPEQFALYRDRVMQARQEAEESLTQKVMSVLAREQKKWWNEERAKVREQVETEVHQQKVYRVLAFLQRGTAPDGSEINLRPVRLNRDELVARYGKEFLKRLPRPYVYTVEGGASVDEVALSFGYASGGQMVQDLANAPKMKQAIEAETDARMRERYPDPVLDGSLAEDALTAVHNNKRSELLATELRTLRKLARQDRPAVRAALRGEARQQREAREANRGQLPSRDELRMIKLAAVEMIGRKKIRHLSPHSYRIAEQKAARLAFERASRGDYQRAFLEKRRQILNHELYRAAEKAQLESRKIRDYFTKFSKKRVRERLGRAQDGILEKIETILSDLDLANISGAQIDRNTARREMLAAIESGQLVAPQAVVNELTRDKPRNWREVSMNSLRGLRDIIKQLETQARRQVEMIVNDEKIRFDEVAKEIRDSVESSGKVDIGIGRPSPTDKAKRGAAESVAALLRSSAIARLLDGGQDYGPVTRYVIQPIRRAYAEKMIPMQRKAREDVSEIYRKHYSNRELMGFSSRRRFEVLDQDLSKSDVLSIALNWGNEGNRKALLNGISFNGAPFTQAGVMEALGTLEARDWAFVQDIWDYLDTYWADLSTAEKRRRGISPKKVPATPFAITTSDGQTINIRGGYYPLKYDSRHGGRQAERDVVDYFEKMGNGVFVSANTRAGATHGRVGSAFQVVRLGLDIIDQHLREITRDIAIGDEVNFVKRVLNHKDVKRAMKQTDNDPARRTLNLWLQDAAVGELPADNIWEHGMSWIRTGFTKAVLGWNLMTTALQFTGFAQTWAVVGSGSMSHGVARFAKNPIAEHRNIMELSAFMRSRYEANAWNKDVVDAQDYLASVVPRPISESARAFGATLFLPIAKAQMVVDEITWLSALWKGANERGLDQSDAILYADGVVEQAQTSGFFSDRSAIERGTLGIKTRQSQFVRLWTTLLSYMLAKTGIAYEKTVAFKRNPTLGGAAKLGADLVALFTIEAAMAAAIYGRWPDEDDEEPFVWWLAKESADSVVAGIPGVREVPSARFGGGNTPLGVLAKNIYDVGVQLGQGEVDKTLIKELNNVGGTLFHYPSSQTNRLIDAIWRETQGEEVPWYEYVTGDRE